MEVENTHIVEEQRSVNVRHYSTPFVISDEKVESIQISISETTTTEEQAAIFSDLITTFKRADRIELNLQTIFSSEEVYFDFQERFKLIAHRIRFLKWVVTLQSATEGNPNGSLDHLYYLDLSIKNMCFTDRDADLLGKALHNLRNLHALQLRMNDLYGRIKLTQASHDSINKGIYAMPNLELVHWKFFLPQKVLPSKLATYQKIFSSKEQSQDEVDVFNRETQQQLDMITYIYLQDDGAGFHFYRKQDSLFQIMLKCFSIPYLTNLDLSFQIQSDSCRQTSRLIFTYLNEKMSAVVTTLAFAKKIASQLSIYPQLVLLDLYF